MSVWNITPCSFDAPLLSPLMVGFICVPACIPLMGYDKSPERNPARKTRGQRVKEKCRVEKRDAHRSPGFDALANL